jgi:hypothetical protein
MREMTGSFFMKGLAGGRREPSFVQKACTNFCVSESRLEPLCIRQLSLTLLYPRTGTVTTTVQYKKAGRNSSVSKKELENYLLEGKL